MDTDARRSPAQRANLKKKLRKLFRCHVNSDICGAVLQLRCKNMQLSYTVLHSFAQVLFRAGNQGNHQHFDPFDIDVAQPITLVGNSNDPPRKNSESLYCIIPY